MRSPTVQLKSKIWATIAVFLLTLIPPLTTPVTTPVEAAAPVGFQTELVLGTGLNGPSAIEIAPDGRIFILERTGVVKIYDGTTLLPTPFITLPVVASGDRGLIGVTFDPDFATNSYVYFYYTGTDQLNRIVRYDASGNTATGIGTEIYATTSLSYELHVGGGIAFGPDGKLYLAVGDNGFPPNSQDLSNPHGKIIRINKDGTIPTDNPFYTVPGALPEIYAFGFRNPWRLQFDPVTGHLYVGDVGDFSWEEVNLVTAGGNYGWPHAEGSCTNCPYTNPTYEYAHDGMSSAVTGGGVYYGSDFPAEYQGDYFFADYARGFIRSLELAADGNATGEMFEFDPAAGSVVDLKFAPDGSMYYITFFPARMYRVSYNPSNPQPVVVASADPTEGIEPLDVNFSSAGTYDPNGDDLDYLWDFGDGTTSTAENPTKTYAQKGAYTVELTVSDGENNAKSVPIVIQVGLQPSVNISVPSEGTTYQAGDTITYNAFATDGAGFDMGDSQISTEIVFHHDTHTHPFEGPFLGRTGSFTIPTTGEASPNTWYRIYVTATDDNGLFTTEYRDIFPEKANVTYDTSPSGIPLELDGVPIASPKTLETVVGFERQISAPVTFELGGIHYKFDAWSDGGDRTHTVTGPTTDTTITALYDPDATFSASYFNNTELTGAPVLQRDDIGIHFDWGTGSPDPVVNPNNFSARWQASDDFDDDDYTFTVTADDGVRLYIDGELVIDAWVDQSATEYSITRHMTAGSHDIVLEYYDRWVDAEVDLTYLPEPPNPYTTEFWSINPQTSPDIPTTPADLTRQDEIIAFDWGFDAPDPVITGDGFIARWSNDIEFTAGDYQFFTESDDGVRVYVDGALVIDEWNDHSATQHNSSVVTLSEGTHNIVVEYYENKYDAVARFWYEEIETHTHPYQAEYWNLAAPQTSPVIPATLPDLTRDDQTIDFDWGFDAPDPAINGEGFVARWSNHFHLAAGDYDFYTISDDGIRVFVNGIAVIDEWDDHSATQHDTRVTLPAGTHDIVVEYYENRFDAVAQFWFEAAEETHTHPYSAEYWSLVGGPQTAPAIPATPADVTRDDQSIDFDWGLNTPDPALAADGFVARWTNHFHLDAGDYDFHTISDDGIRVFVNGTAIIDEWNDHSATQHSATIALPEGTHDVVVEYYENRFDAVAQFWFEEAMAGIQSGGSGFAAELPATINDTTPWLESSVATEKIIAADTTSPQVQPATAATESLDEQTPWVNAAGDFLPAQPRAVSQRSLEQLLATILRRIPHLVFAIW